MSEQYFLDEARPGFPAVTSLSCLPGGTISALSAQEQSEPKEETFSREGHFSGTVFNKEQVRKCVHFAAFSSLPLMWRKTLPEMTYLIELDYSPITNSLLPTSFLSAAKPSHQKRSGDGDF